MAFWSHYCGLPCCFRATEFYRIIVPVIFCRVAVLFTLFWGEFYYSLPGGSIIYPVEREVNCSFAGWQGSICRVAICPRLRSDIPFFVSAAWSIFFDIFFFLFRYFLLGSAYSRVFSLACLIFYFSQQLYCYCCFFFVSFSLSFAGFAEGYHLGWYVWFP